MELCSSIISHPVHDSAASRESNHLRSARRRIFFPFLSQIILLVGFVLLLPNNAGAYAFYGPSNTITPTTKPESIVEWQLASLKADDLQQTFQYASPANRAITGPWTRFAAMVKTPAYVDLINHARSEIVMTFHTPDDQQWRCLVRIWPQHDPRGDPKEYWWALSRTKEEKGTVDGFRSGGFVPAETEIFAGCFMVDAVVPNRLLGEIDQRNAGENQ